MRQKIEEMTPTTNVVDEAAAHRMKVQELAILSLVRDGKAQPKSFITPPDKYGVRYTITIWHIPPEQSQARPADDDDEDDDE